MPMTMAGVGVRLLLGVLLGHLLPRLPMLILCRTKGFNLRFAPHPAPPRLGPHLTARVLLMRRLWWGRAPTDPPSVAVWCGKPEERRPCVRVWPVGCAGWTAIQRLVALTDPDTVPVSMTTALRLQAVMNACEDEKACCAHPEPVWGSDGRPLRGVPHRTRPDASTRPRAASERALADGHASACGWPTATRWGRRNPMRRSKVGLGDASKRTNLIACPRSERGCSRGGLLCCHGSGSVLSSCSKSLPRPLWRSV